MSAFNYFIPNIQEIDDMNRNYLGFLYYMQGMADSDDSGDEYTIHFRPLDAETQAGACRQASTLSDQEDNEEKDTKHNKKKNRRHRKK